jgi:hypothetical protein
MARKRKTKTGLKKNKAGKWYEESTGQIVKADDTPQKRAAAARKAKKGGNITRPQETIFKAETNLGTKSVGESQGASRRKQEREVRKKSRSQAASEGWVTRREREAAERRSQAALKGWETRRRNEAARSRGGMPTADLVDQMLKEYAEDVGEFGVKAIQLEAPKETGALADSATYKVKKRGGLYISDISAGTYYSEWVQEGTGIHGPTGSRIYPKTAKALEFVWLKAGSIYMVVGSVAGQEPNPFGDRAYAAVREYSRTKDAELADKLEIYFSTMK